MSKGVMPHHFTMKKRIDSASWQPVSGCLTGDHEYMSIMRRFQDPNDEWTRIHVFGSIGATNKGIAEEKAANRQALGDILSRHQPGTGHAYPYLGETPGLFPCRCASFTLPPHRGDTRACLFWDSVSVLSCTVCCSSEDHAGSRVCFLRQVRKGKTSH